MIRIYLSMILSLVLMTSACSTVDPPEGAAVVRQALNAIGQTCSSNSQCASGVCFDAQDSQQYWPWCYGTVCTTECTSDAQCVQLAQTAGAPHPERAGCLYAELLYLNGSYGHYVCDLLAAGLGSFGCE